MEITPGWIAHLWARRRQNIIDVALFGTKFRALEHVMWRDYSSLRQSMPFIVHVKCLYNFHYLPLHQSGISRADQADFAEDHIGLTTQIRTVPKLMRPPCFNVII